jgi:hypothetical protein
MFYHITTLKMVETPRSSAENLSTSNEAIYWTEKNPNSKLKDIK